MKAPNVRQLSLRAIRHKLREGIFAVPKLQREFVWNGKRAGGLLDSIYHRMPIGSVLVWETKSKGFDLLRQALHILPPFNPANPLGWFLIDGQQRLSVIHEAFEGGVKSNSSGQEIDFGRLCFDLEAKHDDNHVSFAYRKAMHGKYVSVQDILAEDWKRRCKGNKKSALKRIADCRSRLLRYKVPIVVVHSDDLEEVREVFLRINSQGMKISAADRAFARAATVDLRDLSHELRAGVHPEFRDIDPTVVLQGFSFATKERELDVGQRSLEATIQWWERKIEKDGSDGTFYARWNAYRKAFGKAVDHIYDKLGVAHSGLLPSQNMLATLSVFFLHHPAAPNPSQRREIKKWFWATGVAQRYSGRGYRPNLLSDVRFFTRLATSGKTRFPFSDRVDRSDVSRAEYNQRSSLANVFYCLLAQYKPSYIENGECIPESAFASRANRSDKHHIFPRQLLANYRFPYRDYNSLCNICLIAAEENQRFGMKRPDSYLEPYMRRRHFSRAMKSHLIPYDESSGLWTRGVLKAYPLFRKRRLELICRAFEQQAGTKLFRKS